jgi:hypothetical protein
MIRRDQRSCHCHRHRQRGDCHHQRHNGLLTTITHHIDGIALLCHPRHGASLEDFMVLVDAVKAMYYYFAWSLGKWLPCCCCWERCRGGTNVAEIFWEAEEGGDDAAAGIQVPAPPLWRMSCWLRSTQNNERHSWDHPLQCLCHHARLVGRQREAGHCHHMVRHLQMLPQRGNGRDNGGSGR